jgi:hypothetical protein
LFYVGTAYLIKTIIKSLGPGKVKKGKTISKHDMKTEGEERCEGKVHLTTGHEGPEVE